jgi:hypothetical protein
MTRRKINNGKTWRSRLKNVFRARRAGARANMRIELYAACWNEERIIPFFLRHYEPIVDRIVIYDDGSSDRSCELLSASPKVELRQLQKGASYILMQLQELNRCWKESRGRADWVITCDIDEHIYHHHDLREYLRKCQAEGATIIHPLGIEMVSADFPSLDAVLSEKVRCGVRSVSLDKKAIFNPNEIDEINYCSGRHLAKPVGRSVFPREREVKLLHYKALGFDYLLDRTQQLRARKTSFDLERGWGVHDLRSADEIRLGFEQTLHGAQDISLIGNGEPALSQETDQRRL